MKVYCQSPCSMWNSTISWVLVITSWYNIQQPLRHRTPGHAWPSLDLERPCKVMRVRWDIVCCLTCSWWYSSWCWRSWCCMAGTSSLPASRQTRWGLSSALAACRARILEEDYEEGWHIASIQIFFWPWNQIRITSRNNNIQIFMKY